MKTRFIQIHHLILTTLLFAAVCFPGSAALTNDPQTLLLLRFDGNLTGAAGETPSESSGITFEPGIHGQGAYLAPGNRLFYPSAGNLNSTNGTIEFWIKPRWAGDNHVDNLFLRFGFAGGMLLSKTGAEDLFAMFNRWASEGLPEVTVRQPVGDWPSNEWRHVALTWSNDMISLYVNGDLKKHVAPGFPLPTVTDADFRIGAADFGNSADAVFDELRISSVVRTPEEILNDFLDGGLAITSFTYTTNDGAVTITGYTGAGGNVTIPDTIDGLPVISIAEWAFDSCASLTNVTIPDSVTNLGEYAFYFCTNLTELTLSTNLTAIADDAFEFCESLTGIIIPDGVTSIGDWAFDYCTSLTNVTIPDGVITIGEYAFAYCDSLADVTIPASVTSVGSAAFADCPSLAAITVAAGNSNYLSADGILFNKDQTTLIQCPGGKTGSYPIPDGVNSIGYNAFGGCASLTNITIPDSVTTIGDYGFLGCSGLPGMTIPNSVTSIGGYAFSGCTNLPEITLQAGVTNIGTAAFAGCYSMSAITVNPTNPAYSSLDGVLFDKDGSTLLECPAGKAGIYAVPEGVASIAMFAFLNCRGLTGITIPASATNIENYAFFRVVNLVAFTVDPGNPNYSSQDGVLFDKNRTTLTVCPAGKAGSYTVPDGVTTILSQAFTGCTGLTSVTIPASVASIGAFAFQSCDSLVSVHFLGNAPSPDMGVFLGVNNATVYYRPGTSGWDSTFAALPTVLWNAQVATEDASFGVRTNQFGFNITGTADIPIVVEACTNLAAPAWTPMQTCTVTNGSIYFCDEQWTNRPTGFYRVRWP